MKGSIYHVLITQPGFITYWDLLRVPLILIKPCTKGLLLVNFPYLGVLNVGNTFLPSHSIFPFEGVNFPLYFGNFWTFGVTFLLFFPPKNLPFRGGLTPVLHPLGGALSQNPFAALTCASWSGPSFGFTRVPREFF